MDLQFYLYLYELADRVELFSYISPDFILNPLVKSVPPAILFWVLWFFPHGDIAAKRQKLMLSLIVAAVAICTGRGLSLILPFKLRPMYEATITQIPYVNVDLSEWSAFPSDHAVLFFSLVTCFFWIGRFVGTLAFLHAVFIVLLPRILLGFHWPSDILGGSAIGIAVALIAIGLTRMRFDRTELYTMASRHQIILYPVLIFATAQIAVMFSSMRLAASKLFLLFS